MSDYTKRVFFCRDPFQNVASQLWKRSQPKGWHLEWPIRLQRCPVPLKAPKVYWTISKMFYQVWTIYILKCKQRAQNSFLKRFLRKHVCNVSIKETQTLNINYPNNCRLINPHIIRALKNTKVTKLSHSSCSLLKSSTLNQVFIKSCNYLSLKGVTGSQQIIVDGRQRTTHSYSNHSSHPCGRSFKLPVTGTLSQPENALACLCLLQHLFYQLINKTTQVTNLGWVIPSFVSKIALTSSIGTNLTTQFHILSMKQTPEICFSILKVVWRRRHPHHPICHRNKQFTFFKKKS